MKFHATKGTQDRKEQADRELGEARAEATIPSLSLTLTPTLTSGKS